MQHHYTTSPTKNLVVNPKRYVSFIFLVMIFVVSFEVVLSKSFLSFFNRKYCWIQLYFSRDFHHWFWDDCWRIHLVWNFCNTLILFWFIRLKIIVLSQFEISKNMWMYVFFFKHSIHVSFLIRPHSPKSYFLCYININLLGKLFFNCFEKSFYLVSLFLWGGFVSNKFLNI